MSSHLATPLSFYKASLMTCRHSRPQVDIVELQQSGVLGQDFPNLPGTAAVRPPSPHTSRHIHRTLNGPSSAHTQVGLSHIMLLEQLLVDAGAPCYLIFEDDAIVPKDLVAKLAAALSALPSGWHVLNLGCSPSECKGNTDSHGLVAADPRVLRLSFPSACPSLPSHAIPFAPLTAQCLAGLFGYVVAKAGADAMLAAAIPLRTSIHNQIRSYFASSLRAYCLRPALVTHNDAVAQLRTAMDN